MDAGRRNFLALGIGACLPALSSAQSDAYPSRPITLVVPSAAGSGTDIMGRYAAQKLSLLLGQPVVIENLPGASGVLGVMRVVRARPDGYTALLTFNQTITMNPFTVANLPYDPLKDLEPVSRFGESAFVWIVNAQVPVQTFPELLSYAKAHPKKLAVSMPGFGSAAYLGTQLLTHQTGAEFLAVNYRTNAAPDLISNVVQLTMAPAAQAPGLLASGKMRALATTGSKRLSGFPDLPTVNEFIPGHIIEGWTAAYLPKGTPPSVVAAMSKAWRTIATMPEVVTQLTAGSATPVGSSAEELTEITHRELRLWGDLVKALDIKPAQ